MSIELRDRIGSKHRSGEGCQNISAALKVPKNTVASIILKWKRFATTKPLPRAGRSGEKGLGQGGDQEPNAHADRAPEILCGDGSTFQKDNHLCILPQSGLYGKVARRKPLLSKKQMTARLEFPKILSGLMKARMNSLA